MKFSIGDRVSFLNENQSGVISAILGNKKVMVEIEDGFEIEVFESELVKAVHNEIKSEPKSPETDKPEPLIQTTDLKTLCSDNSICFIAVPAHQNAVLTGAVNFYIVNNTRYALAFTLFSLSGRKAKGELISTLTSESQVLVCNYERQALTDISNFRMDALFFSGDHIPMISHIHKDIPVLLPDIRSTSDTASANKSFAKIFELFSSEEPEPEKIKDLITKLNSNPQKEQSLKSNSAGKVSAHSKYGIHINTKIVDLHIEELTSDFTGLTNSEMIALQLKKFHKEMDEAIRNHFSSITFIHGVGNGVLKREIRIEISHYPNVKFRDGDYTKFGAGATEVIF